MFEFLLYRSHSFCNCALTESLECATLFSNFVIGVCIASPYAIKPKPFDGPTGSQGNTNQIPLPCKKGNSQIHRNQ